MRGTLLSSIGGRVLVASASTLVAFVGTLVLLLPLTLNGYSDAPSTTAPEAIGARLISAIVLAALVGGLVALVVSSLMASTVSGPIAELADRAAADVSGRRWSLSGWVAPEIARLASGLQRIAREAAERQAAAESQRDRMATLLREMADAVLIIDADDHVREANPAADRLLGRAGVVGRPLVEVAHEHELLEVVRTARREGAATMELERMEPRRAVRLVAHRITAGEVLVTAQDLTTLRRLETVRRDFVANVSHELRTPIASLKAMAEALEGGAIDDPEAAHDFVSRMHREIDELGQLVAELMTLTRVESGADRIERIPIRPGQLVATASRLRPLADRAGVTLEVSSGDALPAILADPERIAQTISNLVHNAVKFTPPGGRVDVYAEPAESGIRFVVRDTGTGIPRDEIDRIFERFYKGERSRSGSGTGLGLAIARHVVEAHGGTISAESAGPGRGSTFSFTLPLAAARSPAPT